MPPQLITFREFESKPLEAVPKPVLAALQALDAPIDDEKEAVFDFSRAGRISARHYVGVVQVGSVAIEILPKAPADAAIASKNILTMMKVAGHLPLLDRDLAMLGTQRHPLFEILIQWYARSLLTALRPGLARRYIRLEEISGFVRGKIQLAEQLRRNLFHPERVAIEFDELSVDIPMNRTLKRATTLLTRTAQTVSSQTLLRDVLFALAEVEDVVVTREQARTVRTTRQDERFGPTLQFARLVIEGHTPTLAKGGMESLSLLVSMHRLFEDYIGQTIRNIAPQHGSARSQVHVQARGHTKHLARKPTGQKIYRLKPDVLVKGPEGQVVAILDTKWKVLRPTNGAPGRASERDMYQLYAYAQRFSCPRNILLYPDAPTAAKQILTLDDDPSTTMETALVRMDRDLFAEREQLWEELAHLVWPARASRQAVI